MKTILVTGAAGFLGREVLRQLTELGEEIIPIDNFDKLCGSQSSPTPRFFREVHMLDVRNMELPPPSPKYPPPTHIIHLAAYGRNLTCENYPARAWDINVNGTFRMLELARQQNARIVVCSSNIVLSPRDTVYKDTKIAAENLVRMYARLGVSALGLRPSNIAGPGQSRTEFQPCAFAGMDTGFEKDGYISISGDGTQTRDFVHVSDVARAFIVALDSTVKGRTIDICTGRQISMNGVLDVLGNPPRKYTDPRPNDAHSLPSFPSAAREMLGFEAKIPIEQSIRDSFPAVMRAQSGNPRK
jgi:UDP-glucose 4-epimerase